MSFVENVGRREDVETGVLGGFVELGGFSLNGNERNKLFRNECAGPGEPVRFTPYGYLAGVHRVEDDRGAAVADIDADGDLDILLQGFEVPARLLVNQGDGIGNWLEVKLHGRESNRDAIGARVVIEAGGRSQIREVSNAAGFLAGQSLLVHFGLADAETVERLRVHWPSGRVSSFADVAANQRLQIVEGEDGYRSGLRWTDAPSN